MTPNEIRRMVIGVILIILGLIGFATCSRMDDSAQGSPPATAVASHSNGGS